MTYQLSIGTVVILATVLISAAFAGSGAWAMDRLSPWTRPRPRWIRFMAVLTLLVIWIQIAASICVWIWAGIFLLIGAMPDLETAVYFAIVCFTTLGFGDIILPPEFRILSGLSAANGLLLFGFFTAFLVEMMRRLRREQVTGHADPLPGWR